MKDLFPGYYRPTDEEFRKLWEECFFVFDANLLLNLYRYSAETRQSLLAVLKGIADRCWMAYQAALEFHENRLQVIDEQIAAYKRFHNPLTDFEAALANKRTHPFLATETLDGLKKAVLNVQEELDRRRQQYEKLLSTDDILDEITAIFTGRTGSKLPEQREAEVRKLGEGRYKNKIPPGFKDEAKGDPRKFGDLLLWFQIIEEAKKRQRPVVLVTDDSKEDWWWIVNGRTIGPRPELVEEMKREANIRFYMYEPDRFMSYAETYLKQKVKQEAIQEVREVAELQAQGRKVEKEIVEEVKRQVPSQAVSEALGSHSSSISDLVRTISEQQAVLKGIATPSPAIQEIARHAAEIGKIGALFSPPPAILEISRMMAEQQAVISKITSPISSSLEAFRRVSEQITAPHRAMSEVIRQMNEQQAVYRNLIGPLDSIREMSRVVSEIGRLGAGFPFPHRPTAPSKTEATPEQEAASGSDETNKPSEQTSEEPHPDMPHGDANIEGKPGA
jgi:hypothetical protein